MMMRRRRRMIMMILKGLREDIIQQTAEL